MIPQQLSYSAESDETSLLVLHFKAVRIRERVGRRWRVREGNGRHFDSVVEGMQSGGETSAETWKLSWKFANDFVVKVRTNGFHGSGKGRYPYFHAKYLYYASNKKIPPFEPLRWEFNDVGV